MSSKFLENSKSEETLSDKNLLQNSSIYNENNNELDNAKLNLSMNDLNDNQD